jgi:hypothetical protein
MTDADLNAILTILDKASVDLRAIGDPRATYAVRAILLATKGSYLGGQDRLKARERLDDPDDDDDDDDGVPPDPERADG